MNLALRAASVLALAAAALAANAQASYSFFSSQLQLSATILAAVPATSTTTYVPPAVTGVSRGLAVTQAELILSDSSPKFDFSFINSSGNNLYSLGGIFPVALLTNSGTASVEGITFTSVVTPTATPEPSALAALGLGALGLLRRRKRA